VRTGSIVTFDTARRPPTLRSRLPPAPRFDVWLSTIVPIPTVHGSMRNWGSALPPSGC